MGSQDCSEQLNNKQKRELVMNINQKSRLKFYRNLCCIGCLLMFGLGMFMLTLCVRMNEAKSGAGMAQAVVAMISVVGSTVCLFVTFHYQFQLRPRSEDGRWLFPSFEREMGEVLRFAMQYRGLYESVNHFIRIGKSSPLTELTEEVWEKLENTDSFSVQQGGWGFVRSCALHSGRDWATLKMRMDMNLPVDAPIIVHHKKVGRFHLLSGNTRLMVARALAIRPHVVMVEIAG
jgi:hypothetical protein